MRKKPLVCTILIISQIYCFGQSYDTIATRYFAIKDNVLNYIDTTGQKQGEWLFYKMFFNVRCSAIAPSTSDTCYRKISKGFYKDNMKVGQWEYYNDDGCVLATEKIEYYNPDGSVKIIEDLNSTTTIYNNDSSLVISTIVIDEQHTIIIECANRKQCVATFNNNTLFAFPYEDLDFKQNSFAIGVYEREIRLLKESTH